MKYLKIINEGIIEPQALSLLGASTKRDDNTKIGQFGSGNKYALAYFIRNGEVRVYAGKNEIPIETKAETFRDKTFNVVYIGGEKTSITTEFGLQWQFWQAVREVYSNALDEGKASIKMVDKIEPKDGETHFYISGSTDNMQEFVDNFDLYFSERRKSLYSNHIGQIFGKGTNQFTLYRKGIKCFDTPMLSLFDYNLYDVEINEERTVKYSYYVTKYVWELIFACTNKDIIKTVLTSIGNNRYFEGSIGEYASLSGIPSQAFIEVLDELVIAPRAYLLVASEEEIANSTFIPDTLFKHIENVIKHTPKGMRKSNNGDFFVEMKPTPLYVATVEKALAFFKECDFEIPYEIKYATFKDKKILGIAEMDENCIYLSDIGLEKGVNDVCNTIMEEYIHLKHGVRDETRAMQTATITEIISYMKRKNAYVL